MKSVEVDVRGLSGNLLSSIIKRAVQVSCGMPVTVIVDGEDQAAEVSVLAGKLRRKASNQAVEGGSVKIELTK